MTVKISELPAGNALDGTELLEMVQGGVSKQVTAKEISLVQAREVLTADRTYYVRTDGSDSNDGLSNTAGGAFLTVQHAVNVVAGTLDISSYNVTISVQAGTYNTTGTGLIAELKPYVGAGHISIAGVGSASVTFNSALGQPVIRGVNAGLWYVSGCKITSTTNGIISSGATSISFFDINFGLCSGNHMVAGNGGSITAVGNYSISGGTTSGAHVYAIANASINTHTWTVTITGTPNFGAGFAWCDRGLGYFSMYGMTFVGSATGKRYTLNNNAVCFVNGAGASYLPGNIAGTTTNGAQYN